MRYRATIEYDGTDFFGWQRQPDRRSVQGVLEAAISGVTGEPVTVVGAGRTDIGVHAIGQVAHFDSLWGRGAEALARAINAALPRDAAVWDLSVAADAFHARHDAVARTYVYTLVVQPTRSPLLRRGALSVAPPLDVERMADAAARFVGAYDLAAFGRPMTPGGPTVRRVDRCAVRRDGRRVWVEVTGNAFLRHQVRRMVGVLVDVGRGRCEPEAVGRALAGEAGAVKPRSVPPQGLVLVAVRYPPTRRVGAPGGTAGENNQDGADDEDENVYAEAVRRGAALVGGGCRG